MKLKEEDPGDVCTQARLHELILTKELVHICG